ncbi:MAG: LanC-like protein [Pseudomonadota bacterium]|nr:LanC-like protein [Pseudomonadota bacterium]
MLYDPARHEPLRTIAWDETRARETIAHIVGDTEERFSLDHYWPLHPRDADVGETEPAYPLYHGACGVIWALDYLQRAGAVRLRRSYAPHIEPLLARNAAWLASFDCPFEASYAMGATGILLVDYAIGPSAKAADHLATLVDSNIDNPTRELMWGAPGTLLAASFMHERTGEPRWAELFRKTVAHLRSQLLWSPDFECHYWTQDMYGACSTYLDAVHGFVATASVLIRGRNLLAADDWRAWETCIANTVRRTAAREGNLANWRTWLYAGNGSTLTLLMQFCRGAPGFVVCLAGMPGTSLDDCLLAAGEATWAAGPLAKGSNLCHGTGGNGYAFLALHARTKDPLWLDRARAFAMHAIEQTHADERRFGRLRYSLWTGDPGFAIYLWDCIQATARFPTLDVLFAAA